MWRETFLSNERFSLKTLDLAFRISAVCTNLFYFDLYLTQHTWTRLLILCYVCVPFKVRFHTVINRADFVSWCMLHIRTTVRKCIVVRKWRCTFVGESLNHIHQDTKSARLIAMCKRSFMLKLHRCLLIIILLCIYLLSQFFITWRMKERLT